MRPAGIPPGGFILTPDSITTEYTAIQFLFSFSAMTDTGSKSFDCALVSVLEPYEGLSAGGYLTYLTYVNYLFVLRWVSLHLDYLNYCLLIRLFRLFVGTLTGNRRISNAVRAGSEKAPRRAPKQSMGGTGGQHHRKASCGPSWRYRNHSVRHGSKLSGCRWRQPPGCER